MKESVHLSDDDLETMLEEGGRAQLRCGQRCNGYYQHEGIHRCVELEVDETPETME